MPYFTRLCLFILFAVSLSSCYLTKAAMDRDMVKVKTKNAREMEALALFAVAYAKEKRIYYFNTNESSEPEMKRLGTYGSLVSVNIKNLRDTIAWVKSNILFADSTVMFSSITLRGTLRTIYDLAKVPRHFSSPDEAHFFQAITDRIYYVRTPVPLM